MSLRLFSWCRKNIWLHAIKKCEKVAISLRKIVKSRFNVIAKGVKIPVMSPEFFNLLYKQRVIFFFSLRITYSPATIGYLRPANKIKENISVFTQYIK